MSGSRDGAHISTALLFASIAFPGAAAAQMPPVEAKAPEGKAAAIGFADGSTVRITVLTDKVDIATKYGRLAVPFADIQTIEFRVPGAEELPERIDAAIERLGDPSFEIREAASKELTRYAGHAVKPLQTATESPDAEVVMRAERILEDIRTRGLGDQRPFPPKDRIRTQEFTIVGRITTTAIKARTPYFGDVDLRLKDLRTFRRLNGQEEFEIHVDAGRYGNQNVQWLETEVELTTGSRIFIAASGEVDLWEDGTGQYKTGPDGYRANVMQQQGQGGAPRRAGSLVAKIGRAGPEFVVGSHYEASAERDGRLFLRIAASPWGNRSVGEYSVAVTKGP